MVTPAAGTWTISEMQAGNPVPQLAVLTGPKLNVVPLMVSVGDVADVRPNCCSEYASEQPSDKLQESVSAVPSISPVPSNFTPLPKIPAMLKADERLTCVPKLWADRVAASTTTLPLRGCGKVALFTVFVLFRTKVEAYKFK